MVVFENNFLDNLLYQIQMLETQFKQKVEEYQERLKENKKKLQTINVRDKFKILIEEYISHLK